MERFQNEVSVGWSRSSNNSTGKRVLDVLKAIRLSFWKTIVQGIAKIKSWVNKRCANGRLSSIEVYDWADATKITDVVEAWSRDRRNLIFESSHVTPFYRQTDTRTCPLCPFVCSTAVFVRRGSCQVTLLDLCYFHSLYQDVEIYVRRIHSLIMFDQKHNITRVNRQQKTNRTDKADRHCTNSRPRYENKNIKH